MWATDIKVQSVFPWQVILVRLIFNVRVTNSKVLHYGRLLPYLKVIDKAVYAYYWHNTLDYNKIVQNKLYNLKLFLFERLLRLTIVYNFFWLKVDSYIITNTLQLSIYTSMNSFYLSNLKCLRSKTFETCCLMFWKVFTLFFN